jgi:hypothetical protein
MQLQPVLMVQGRQNGDVEQAPGASLEPAAFLTAH